MVVMMSSLIGCDHCMDWINKWEWSLNECYHYIDEITARMWSMNGLVYSIEWIIESMWSIHGWNHRKNFNHWIQWLSSLNGCDHHCMNVIIIKWMRSFNECDNKMDVIDGCDIFSMTTQLILPKYTVGTWIIFNSHFLAECEDRYTLNDNVALYTDWVTVGCRM